MSLFLQDDIKDKQQETDEVQLRIAWQYRRYIKSKQKAAANASTSSRSLLRYCMQAHIAQASMPDMAVQNRLRLPCHQP